MDSARCHMDVDYQSDNDSADHDFLDRLRSVDQHWDEIGTNVPEYLSAQIFDGIKREWFCVASPYAHASSYDHDDSDRRWNEE